MRLVSCEALPCQVLLLEDLGENLASRKDEYVEHPSNTLLKMVTVRHKISLISRMNFTDPLDSSVVDLVFKLSVDQTKRRMTISS